MAFDFFPGSNVKNRISADELAGCEFVMFGRKNPWQFSVALFRSNEIEIIKFLNTTSFISLTPRTKRMVIPHASVVDVEYSSAYFRLQLESGNSPTVFKPRLQSVDGERLSSRVLKDYFSNRGFDFTDQQQ